jgi:predicted transcriptional regulator of viral defense system
MLRVQRGIYRLVHFPAGDHEELVTAWLWSDSAGVVSHESALALHGLSDVLPRHIHLTLPADWKKRRFRTPADVVLHFSDVPPNARAWFGAAPATNAERTLEDWARASLSPELLRQAYDQALLRGLVAKDEVPTTVAALNRYWGGV